MQNSHCLLGLVSTTNLQRNLTASIRFRHSGCDWGRLRWFQYHFGRQSHSLVYWDSRNTYTEWPWSRGGIEKYFFFIHYCTMHQTLKWAEEKNNSRMINFGIDFLPNFHRKTYFFAGSPLGTNQTKLRFDQEFRVCWSYRFQCWTVVSSFCWIYQLCNMWIWYGHRFSAWQFTTGSKSRLFPKYWHECVIMKQKFECWMFINAMIFALGSKFESVAC